MKKFMCTKMKIFLLILLILSISCYTFAAINLYNSNYSLSSYFSNISNWHGIHDWHIGWGKFDNHLSGDMKKDFPETIENININTTSSDIILSTHDDAAINMNITGDFNSKYSYNDCIKRFDVTNKDINIETSNENFFDDVSLNISIPINYTGSIKIKTLSGNLSISSLTLSNLSLSTTSGDIKAYNITASNSNINSTSGEFDYTGSLGECNINSTSGDMRLSLSKLGESTNISSTSGEINVSLDSSLGYTANLNSNSGEIEARNMDGRNLHPNKNYSFTNGDGSKSIFIHTTSGDISIY